MTVGRTSSIAAALVLAVVATGCAAAGNTQSSGPSGSTLTIYAAASLKKPLDAVQTAYHASPPDVRFSISTDSSTALAAKIRQGAPADVFLSADTTNPASLAAAGLVQDPVPFASNGLAIVVPATGSGPVSAATDLARPGVKIVAAADGVPVTSYATKLIANLATQPGFPDDFATRYRSNIVSREDNVGAVLAKVEIGEADAGIVYTTDAKSSTKVRSVPFPAAANVRATYAGAVVSSSPNRGSAASFLGWLAGPDGQAALAPFGFLPPP